MLTWQARTSIFARAFSRLFSISQQYFSFTTNQLTVFSAAYFQPIMAMIEQFG
jgi:hypothetical protein